jgi:NitT/TauT family transport system permease protein
MTSSEAAARPGPVPAVAPIGTETPRMAWGALALPAATLAVAVLVLLVWQFLPPALGVPRFIIPTITDMAAEMGRMWRQENLFSHLVSTASMAAIGFVAGGILGAACGYALGLSRLWERVLSPYILALQIAPKVAFAPLFIMWFGYNAWPKLVVTVLVVFFPILVNVLQSMKTTDRDLVNLARAYSMTRAQIFWKVYFPASMPNLLAGLRIGATLAVIGVTVGELVGGSIGLGYLITYGEGQANTAMVFDAILLLTVIGIALYWVVAAAEARILHYLPRIAQ